MISKKLIATLGMLLIVLAGCGGNDAAGGDDVITIMAPLMGADAPADDNDFELKLEEMTGHKIKMTWVPDSQYNDKLNVTMASGDLPNIIVAKDKSPAIYDYIDAGAFWQLDDYLADYPNLDPDEVSKSNASFNGDTFGIYRSRDLVRSTIMVNQQWLDNLGLEMPTTVDEFTDMCNQFTNNDPDGNGVDDTYCLSVPKWDGGLNTNSSFDMMEIWFGAPNKWGYVEDEQQWMPDFMTEQYMEGLNYFKMLYDKGYMNSDFAVLPTDDWAAKFINGEAGAVVDTQSMASSVCKSIQELNNDLESDCAKYVDIANTMEYNGEKHMLPTSGFSGQLMMPKESNDEEQLKADLDFINKLASDEISRYINSGVEGVDYTLDENGNPVGTADFPNKTYVESYSKLAVSPTPRTTPQDSFQEKRYKLQDEGLDYIVNNQLEPLFSSVYAEVGANLEYIMADARVQYIAGEIDEQGYQDAVDLWLSSGGQDYIDEMNQLAADKNIEPQVMY